MRHRLTKRWIFLAITVAAAASLAVIYLLVDPFPPGHFAIAAGIRDTTYDDYARQYARALARNGVDLEVRNYAGAIEHFAALRDPASGVQAAIAGFGFTEPSDAGELYSLGGISDSPVFVFYRGADTITQFAQMRGKRLSIGTTSTALRKLMLDVLQATGGLDTSTHLADLDYPASIDALIAGDIGVAVLPLDLGDPLLKRGLEAPGVRLMNATQAEAISKKIAGLKHVVLSQGLIDLGRNLPDADVNLLAIRNRILVRKDLHPALQYLLLEAMREVHWPAGPFSRIGEFPAEQPNDLPLSPTAEAFYRSGPTFWQRNTSFWLKSLLNRVVFFVVPVVAVMLPLLGLALQVYRSLSLRPINRAHRRLAAIERRLSERGDGIGLAHAASRVALVESEIRSLSVARSFEVDLQRLRVHLRMVQDEIQRREADRPPASA